MKTKSKKKNKKTVPVRKAKARHYEPHYLALVLIALLLFEGFAITSTSTADWEKSANVLDAGESFSLALSDTARVFRPVLNVINDVNTFYELSTSETMTLLDLSDLNITNEVTTVTGGVSAFYEAASLQMAQFLDSSSHHIFQETVSGISITF